MIWIYIFLTIIAVAVVLGQISNIIFCFLSYKERVDMNLFNKRYSDLQDEIIRYRGHIEFLRGEYIKLKMSYDDTNAAKPSSEPETM